jgi:hypothetical protein
VVESAVSQRQGFQVAKNNVNEGLPTIAPRDEEPHGPRTAPGSRSSPFFLRAAATVLTWARHPAAPIASRPGVGCPVRLPGVGRGLAHHRPGAAVLLLERVPVIPTPR